MLIYGYEFDLDDLSQNLSENLISYAECASCYSTGRHQPSVAVFGIRLIAGSCLFNPIEILPQNLEITQTQQNELKDIWESLSPAIKEKAKNQKPKIFMFDRTND